MVVNPRRIGDRLVWAVRSNDLTHWATPHSNEEFNKKNKNKLKRKYKNAVEQEYLDIYNKILESIDDKGKLLLFKTLKTEYKLELYKISR